MQLLIHIVILVIVVGAVLYILNLLPIDATVKAIGRVVILVVAAVYAITLLMPMVKAQPVPDTPGVLERLLSRTDNSPLTCNVYRNLNRDGDIQYLRLDCRNDRRWERGR